MKKLYTVEGGRLRLEMHEGQLRAWDSDARIIAVLAGSQGGKTSWGPFWLWREVQRCGAGDYIGVTASYDLFKLKMLPEIRNVFEHLLGIGRYWSGDKILELADPETGQFHAKRADDPMWGRIILRSASAEGGLESATAKAAWADEAGQDDFKLTAWEALRRRLTLYRGRVLITTTPYNLGWLKQLVEQPSSEIELINFPSTANPNFSTEEAAMLKATMPKWKYDMFHEGKFSRPPGMIYNDFIDEYREKGGHKVKPFDLPRHWARFLGVDPGIINTCKVWLAQDPETFVYYVYRESLGDRKASTEHAEDAIELARQNGEYIAKTAVGSKSEIYHRQDWEAAGIGAVLEPEHAAVEARINHVIALLRLNRLFFFDTCTGALDQMGTYSRVLDSEGNATEKIKDKEKYHFLDALGYIAEHLDFYDMTIGQMTYAAQASFGRSDY